MKWILALLSLALWSCTTAHIQKVGAVDPRNKTIVVNMSGGSLSNSIKNALRADGWKVMLQDGLTVNPGSGLKFDGHGQSARYSMKVDAVFIDHAFPTFEKIHSFDLYVADNLSGEEIANGHGADTEKNITAKVMSALK